jgi:acyl carrier protein
MSSNAIQTLSEVKSLLNRSLQLGARADTLTASSPLIGALPELDSMAVVSILTALEEFYGFAIEDDEISADTFATLGSLTEFVTDKLNN